VAGGRLGKRGARTFTASSLRWNGLRMMWFSLTSASAVRSAKLLMNKVGMSESSP
jgi:hypothetical protein